MEDRQTQLSRMYLEEYLRGKGHTWQSVRKLPEAAGKQILIEASTYVAIKLAEVEARARVEQEIRGGTTAE